MKELKLPQLNYKLVPVAEQCKTQPSDMVQLIVLGILSGRQAIVNLDKWVSRIDLEKLIRPELEPSSLNDDAIGRHLDWLYEPAFTKLRPHSYCKPINTRKSH